MKSDAGKILARASGTGSVEVDLVALDPHAPGSQAAKVQGTALDLEHLPAAPAFEVVMVVLARGLVAVGGAGKLDGDQMALPDERLDRAVHRRDSQPPGMGSGGAEEFLGRERSRMSGEGPEDRPALPRVPFHASKYSGGLRSRARQILTLLRTASQHRERSRR